MNAENRRFFQDKLTAVTAAHAFEFFLSRLEAAECLDGFSTMYADDDRTVTGVISVREDTAHDDMHDVIDGIFRQIAEKTGYERQGTAVNPGTYLWSVGFELKLNVEKAASLQQSDTPVRVNYTIPIIPPERIKIETHTLKSGKTYVSKSVLPSEVLRRAA